MVLAPEQSMLISEKAKPLVIAGHVAVLVVLLITYLQKMLMLVIKLLHNEGS